MVTPGIRCWASTSCLGVPIILHSTLDYFKSPSDAPSTIPFVRKAMLGADDSPPDRTVNVPLVPSGTSKQPRRVIQSITTESKAQSGINRNNLESKNPKGGTHVENSVRRETTRPNQSAEQSDLRQDDDHLQSLTDSPGRILSGLEADAKVETRIVSAITTTQVQERKDVRKAEHSATTKETSQPQRTVTISYPGNALQEQPSSRLPPATSTPTTPEAHYFMPSPRSASGFAAEELLFEIQHLHRQEIDRLLNSMRRQSKEHGEYRRICEEHFRSLQTEKERLVFQVSTLTTTVRALEIKLSSHDVSPIGDASCEEKSTSTITTTTTTITTTITTVTTQIRRWKDTVVKNKGSITLSNTELDNVLSNLSNTSSQITELQEQYTTILKDLGSVRRQLQGTLLLHEQKDETIVSLTAEVAQLKLSDVTKVQNINALGRENETVLKELSTASSRLAQLQHSHDTLSGKLNSALRELQSREELIGEQGRKIVSFSSEITQLKQSNAGFTTQLASLRQDYEVKESSQATELRKQKDTHSKDILSVRNELQESKALVGRQDQTIADLRAEIEQLKNADARKTAQLEGERQDKEGLQHTLSTFTSDIASLQKRCEAQSDQILSIRSDIQAKESLLAEKEQIITSMTTKLDQATHENSMTSDLLSTSHRDAEQLQKKLSDARDENTNIQNQYNVQSIELNKLRAELERLGPDGKIPDGGVAKYITQALEDKEEQIEELGQRLSTGTSRNNELEKLVEELERRFNVLKEELTAKTSQFEGTIGSLTNQVEQLKATDTAKSDQLSTAIDRARALELKISTITPQFSDLQARFTSQSKELASANIQLQTMSSSIQEKSRDISSLISERERMMSESAAQKERIAELQGDLATTTVQFAELQGDWKAQSSELVSVQRELEATISSVKERDIKTLALSDEIVELKRMSGERLAAARKEANIIQVELSDSHAQITALQNENQMQSIELESLRTHVKALVSGKDGTTALTTQIGELKTLYTAQGEELMTVGKNLNQLRLELKISSSQSTELKHELDSQITRNEQTTAQLTTAHMELERLRRDLSASSTRIEEYQTQLVELNTKIKHWEQSDTAQKSELSTAHAELKRLRVTLSTSSTQLEEYRVQFASQVEKSKMKAEELVVANKKLDRLQRDVEGSSSQISELRNQFENQSAKLKFYEEQLLLPDGGENSLVDSEEWKRIREIIVSEVKDYSAVIQLTAKVDEWLHDDGKRAEALMLELEKRKKENEELQQKLLVLKEIYIRAPRIKQIFQSETIEIRRRDIESIETRRRYEEETKSLKAALEDSQSQLRGVQRVVATADTYADETIVQALKKLNAEVQHNTTLMAEALAGDFQPRAARATREQVSAMQKIAKIVGQPLTAGLADMNADDAALYLSIAFQAFFSYHLYQLISSWTIEKGHNDFIKSIYEQLQKAETQPMSGRWRALTRAYISPSWISNPNTATTETLVSLSDLVVAAGCATSVSAAKSKLSSFKDKIQSIITIAGKFSKIIGEVVSADFSVTAPVPRLEFDTTMELEDMDDGESQASGTVAGQKVLCSTQLGMTKRMQREVGKETLTVVKAKVVLESFLNA